MEVVKRKRTDLIALLLGGLIALLLAPAVAESSRWLLDLYDSRNPPVSASLAVASHPTSDSLRIRMLVSRNRDCDFVRLVAFSGPTGGPMEVATKVRREDDQEAVNYPPGAEVLSKPWVIYPVFGPRLVLVGHYECGNRLVRTRMIDEVVP